MRRNRNQSQITGGKRFTVSDVPDMSTPAGTAKTQDEFRKLAMDLNDFSQDVSKQIGDVAAKIPTPPQEGGSSTKPPATKPFPNLQVWQDGITKVNGSIIWDFAKTDQVTFKVTDLGGGHALIKAYTNYKNPLNVMWGLRNGGYLLEIPNSGTAAIPAYNSLDTKSSPWVVEKSRTLLHFVGDAGLFESADAAPRMGFFNDKPAAETAVWAAETANVSVNGETYDISTVKIRVVPFFQVIGDPSRGTFDTGEHSSVTLTRIQFYDTDTVEVHVDDHPNTAWPNATKVTFNVKDDTYSMTNVGDGAGIYKDIVSRTFRLKSLVAGANISFSVGDDTITINATSGGSGTLTYTAANEATAGANIGSVYSTTVGTEFRFRRIKGIGNIYVYEDSGYVVITPYTVSGEAYGSCTTLATPYNFYYDTVVDDTGHTVKLRFRNFGRANDLFVTVCGGGGIILDVNESIQNMGTGYQIGIDKTYVGTQTFHNIRTLTPGNNISIDYGGVDDKEIIISAAPSIPVFRNAGADTGEIHISTRFGGCVTSFDTTAPSGSITPGKYYCTTTGGTGSGLTVLVVKVGSVVTFHIVDTGTGYTVGDTVTLIGVASSTAHVGTVNNSNIVVNLKTLSANGDMFVSQTGYDITYYHTVVINSVAGADTSTKKTLYTGKTSSNGDVVLGLKSIVAGSGLSISSDSTTVTLTCTITDTNDTYLMANVGTGAGQVWRNTTDAGSVHTFNLKTIKAGAGITVVNNADDITIICNVTDTNDTYFMANVGTGEGRVWRDTTDAGSAHTFNIKSIKSGTGITVTNNANEIVIACNLSVIYYSHRVVDISGNVMLRLDGTDPSQDDVWFSSSDSSITITRVNDDNMDFIANFPTPQIYDIDNCSAGTGTGLVYHDNTVAAGTTTFHMRKIKAGAGMTVTTTGHSISLDCDIVDTNDVYSVVNVGTGAGTIWRDTTDSGSSHTFNLKRIKAGSFIVVTNEADDVLISTWDIDGLKYGICTTLATPYNFYYDTYDDAGVPSRKLRFRNFAVTNDLFLTECGGKAYVLDVNVIGVNTGGGYGIYSGKNYVGTQTQLDLKSLIPGDGIEMDYTTLTDGIIISAADGGHYDAASLGSETPIYINKTGTGTTADPFVFNFKSIRPGTNVNFVGSTSTVLQINSIDNNDVYTMTNTGTGVGKVWRDTLDTGILHTFNLKSIKAGTGITVVNNADDITIVNTADNDTYDFSNIGTGAGQVYESITAGPAHTVKLRTVKAGTGVTVTNNAEDITIACTVVDTNDTYSTANVGTGAGLIWRNTTDAGSAHTFNLKTVKAGTGITVTNNADDVTISCTIVDTNDTYLMANVGSGTGTIWRDTTGTNPHTFNLKRVKQGNLIKITNEADDILIDCWDISATAYGSCTAISTPYNFYVDTIDTPLTPSRVMRFRNFAVANDLFLTVCGGGAYALSVDVVGANTGGGYEIFSGKTHVSGQTLLQMKSLIPGDGIVMDYDALTEAIIISLEYTSGGLHYSVANIGSGQQVYKDTTGAGTPGSPYVFNLRTLMAGSGISVATTTNEITISKVMRVTAGGLFQDQVTEFEIADNGYDIEFIHSVGTSHLSKVTPHWTGYNFKADTVFFTESGVATATKVVPNNTWEKILFDNVLIDDTPNWVHKDASNANPWYFKPNDVADFNWHITVKLAFVTRHPTSNTQVSSITLPEIALFIGEVYWDTLDVDERVGEFASIRAYLALSDSEIGSSVPESGSKAWLEGSDVAKLVNNYDQLSVRFRHKSGGDKYIKLIKGSISISKTGEKNTRSANFAEASIDFSQV